jgi:glycosyltransferase involved in cell wall biosynthesis
MKTFTVITPCYNAGKYIKETADSVLSQSAVLEGRIKLQYIVCDGGSTDDTLQILNSIASPYIQIISEKDNGMYDALAKGFELATGDIFCYLNAGDVYYNKAFDTVLDVLEVYTEIQWVTGMTTAFNSKTQLVAINVPFNYRSSFFQCGFYGRYFNFLQQESTFWKRELMQNVDLDTLRSLRLAGDSYMWNCFSKHHQLHIVYAFLGGFKVHEGQQSEKIDEYVLEQNRFTRKATIWEYVLMIFDSVAWKLPVSFKKKLNKKYFHYFELENNRWN